MISINASQPEGPSSKIVLINDQNRPTLPFIGLLACELALDCLVGYAAYRLFKALKG